MTIQTETAHTPAVVPTERGPLEFPLAAPTAEAAALAYDLLDRENAYRAYLNGYPAVSEWMLRKGLVDAGVQDGDVLITRRLLDSRSLFLTANADTVYFMTYLDLTDGPVMMRAPEDVLTVVDDMWWRWVTDVGIPGPDRGAGGLYLFVGPDYDGPLPEGGCFVRRSRTQRISVLGRAFLEDDDPAPAVERITATLAFGRWQPGGFGFSIGAFLEGEGPLGGLQELASPRFVEGSGLALDTIPPSDASYFDLLNDAMQAEPASALDPELAGPLAAIGIVHGSPFEPDDRMRELLAEAVTRADAITRAVAFRPRDSEGFAYYPGTVLHWSNPLFAGGYSFQVPPPQVDPNGLVPFPDHGAKLTTARSSFLYLATGITPAMCMNLPGIGSQYILATVDAAGDSLDGGAHYTLTLPAGIPAEKFWSITLYDTRTRSMLVTDQLYPRAGSQAYPTPAAVAGPDGTTVLHLSPEWPADVEPGNWVQTVPGEGFFAILRLYSPTRGFFDRSWKPSDITRA